MKHKCFISFKTEDQQYKDALQNKYALDIIDKSLNNPINSYDEDYIMQVLRRDYLQDSTVTLVLIGTHSAENNFFENQNYIKRELQASLYSKPNGIVGIVLPEMYDKIYKGNYTCSTCGNSHGYVKVDNDITIREFNYNYYLPNNKCAWNEEDRYCILVKWDDFIRQSSYYIQKAFDKREDPIRNKIKVYPK
ncbi:TIR domain-containing protein [Latilactobacillus curvatus]|uniref:TIR domain-containing protein n=1 Tax=Latilactobacillus curvatus TaxID=28038 RepID=UPI0020C785C6|nr:TIR domain-containing protein [Latilactobacillus curvatus]MCP8849145.1 TIR domain-containing protein [Latilactobacillus curvatus]